jgi:hypothetical protein
MELAHLLLLLDDKPEITKSMIDLQERKLHIDEQIRITIVVLRLLDYTKQLKN